MIVSFLIKRLDGEAGDLGEVRKIDEGFAEASRSSDLYFTFLEFLLESLLLTNPTEKIYLKLFNFSEEECEQIKLWNKNVTIDNYYYNVKSSSSSVIDFSEGENVLRHQFLTLANLLLDQVKINEKIIYLDVDCLVRGSVKEMYSFLDENDIFIQSAKTYGKCIDYSPIIMGEQTEDCNWGDWEMAVKINSGVMGFRRNKKTIAFLEEFVNGVDFSRQLWLSSQMCLASIYTARLKAGLISIMELPWKFHDMTLVNEEAVVWHGACTSKPNALGVFADELKYIKAGFKK